MNLGEFVALLSLRCGSRDDLETRIKSELLLVQTISLEQAGAFKPWFLQSDIENLATVAADPTVDFPTDYLGELEDSMLWYQGTDLAWHKLNKKSYDYILEKNIDAGPPQYFAVGATGFFLGPTPDAIYALRFRYYQKDALLVDDTDTNLWLTYAPDLVLAEVGLKICRYHTIDDRVKMEFAQEAAEARQRLFVLHESKQNVNRVYGMGED
jgi:hypothetical protein